MSTSAVRDRATHFGVALLPVLLFVALHFFGYVKFARLGAIALVALVAGAVAFVRPRWGLWCLLFYVYSGVGLFLPVNLAAPLLAIVVGSVLLELARNKPATFDCTMLLTMCVPLTPGASTIPAP